MLALYPVCVAARAGARRQRNPLPGSDDLVGENWAAEGFRRMETECFVAFNGYTYDGSPPTGWAQAQDGRWWPDVAIPRARDVCGPIDEPDRSNAISGPPPLPVGFPSRGTAPRLPHGA